MTYVALGALTQTLVGGIKATEYGQRIELTAEQAETTKQDGGLIAIPAERFDELGHTKEELQRFANAATHDRAPAEFLARKKQALLILHEIRETARQAAEQQVGGGE